MNQIILGCSVSAVAVVLFYLGFFHFEKIQERFPAFCEWGRPGWKRWPASRIGCLSGITLLFQLGLLPLVDSLAWFPRLAIFIPISVNSAAIVYLAIRDFRRDRQRNRTTRPGGESQTSFESS